MKPGTGVTRETGHRGNTFSALYRTPDPVQPLIPHARQQSRNREPPLLRTERFKPDRLAPSLPREADRGPVELDAAAVFDLPHGPSLWITDIMPHRRSPMG